VVILIDAYMALENKMAMEAEPRSWTITLSTVIFRSLRHAAHSLRATQLQFAETLLNNTGEPVAYHLENLDKDANPEIAWLGNRLNRIPTSLKIESKNAARLRSAARILVKGS